MKCEDARELMLEAELEEMRSGALGEHLTGCAVCESMAAQLSASMRNLQVAFAGIASEEAAEGVAQVAMNAGRIVPIRRPVVTRREIIWSYLGIAGAAAALALVFRAAMAPGTASAPPTAVGATAAIEVEVPAGKNAIVMNTNNPDITVVWLY